MQYFDNTFVLVDVHSIVSATKFRNSSRQKQRFSEYILKCFFIVTIYLSNVVDIRACLKIAELYDFINPSMPKLSKNQNSRKYAKTITDVADRRTKSTLDISDERERGAYGLAIIFSVRSKRRIYFQVKWLFAPRITRAKKSEENADVSYNHGMNLRFSFSSKFNLPPSDPPYRRLYAS